MGREANLRRQHGAARVHLEVARPASEGEPFAGLAANITPRPRNPAFGCVQNNMENELVLAVERVVVQDGRRGGAEVVQLEVTLLACKSPASAVFLAAAAGEEFRQSDFHQGVFGVGVMCDPFSGSRLR